MTNSPVEDDVAAALAVALPLAGLVIVSPSEPPRVLWHDGAVDATELEHLEAVGRDRLRPSADPQGPAEQGPLGWRLIDDPDGVGRGVLFAVLPADHTWTDATRAVFDVGAAALRSDLLAVLGTRPGDDAASTEQLESQLASAAERGELVLLYQPEIDIRTGEILAFEALLRWDHPDHGRLGPDLFIGVAERSDVIKMLGNWVIDHALRDFASWHDDRVTLRINVSPAQLSGEGIVGRLEATLREVGVPARQLGIEFTETATSGDVADLASTLRALTDLGIGSAIDDLATGYSTLSRLRALPVDTVKIDRSLVLGLDHDERARAIVRAVMAMARDLGLDVVGEGVETAAEAEALLELGCRRGQGHYFGHPLDVDAVATLLADAHTALSND